MKRHWINYTLWEDHQAGLYQSIKQPAEIVEQVKQLFEHKNLFLIEGLNTILLWPNSCNHSLSDQRGNRKSYLGQATACRLYGANIKTTIIAWNQLSEEHKNKANETADLCIKIYEERFYVEPIAEVKNENLSV